MANPLNLIPGQKYSVIKAFSDYDKIIHAVGETWTFRGTNFLPYEDGLTLFVSIENFDKELSYRFQWRNEEQAYLINNFSEFVKAL